MASLTRSMRPQSAEAIEEQAEVDTRNPSRFRCGELFGKTGAYALILLSLSFSAQGVNMPATQYDCVGAGVKVSYSTTSFTGQPLMTVRKGSRVFSGRGAEVRIEPTVLGSLVTIVKSAVPDLATKTFTLLAPDVNVPDQKPKVNFLTELFTTKTKTTIGGPALVNGVIQNSISQPLHCSASALVF